jgi:hypothetical protein
VTAGSQRSEPSVTEVLTRLAFAAP